MDDLRQKTIPFDSMSQIRLGTANRLTFLLIKQNDEAYV